MTDRTPMTPDSDDDDVTADYRCGQIITYADGQIDICHQPAAQCERHQR